MAKAAWVEETATGDTVTDEAQLPARLPKEPSANAKEVAFIVTDRRYHRHNEYKKAKAEAYYLSAKHKKVFRTLRVLNVAKDRIALYEAAPELAALLVQMIDAADGLTTWASGPAAWDRAMAKFEPLRAAAMATIAKIGGGVDGQ